MPQDELKGTGRDPEKRVKITCLAKRDFMDLELVRRRLYDAAGAADGQGRLYVALDWYAGEFCLDVVTRILSECEI